MALVKISWTEFKEICVIAKKLSCQWCTNAGNYNLLAFDGPMTYTSLLMDASDIQEFETTYKADFNKVIQAIDTTTRKAITKDEPYNGPLYQVACRFETGRDSNHASWKPPADDPTLWSIDVSNPGYTYVDFHPLYDIQVDGCGYRLRQVSPTNETVIEGIILAPNIPAQYGGNYVFASNFEVIGDYDKFERFTAPKYLKYYPQTPEANRIRFKIKHDAAEHVKMSVYLGVYKVVI